jgi:hypothetical protein
MLRAPSGQTPKGKPMIPRHTSKRKYLPRFESLERKDLMSTALPVNGFVPIKPVAAFVAPQPRNADIALRCGPGKGIVIITS